MVMVFVIMLVVACVVGSSNDDTSSSSGNSSSRIIRLVDIDIPYELSASRTGPHGGHVSVYELGKGPCQQLWRSLPTAVSALDPSLSHVGFAVDEMAPGLVSSACYDFPCQFSFHPILHIHLPSRARTVGHLVSHAPSGLSVTASHDNKRTQSTRRIA
jgi:hypothetical protein